jgi:hypothetical protein
MITPEEPLACLARPGEAKNLATILPLASCRSGDPQGSDR